MTSNYWNNSNSVSDDSFRDRYGFVISSKSKISVEPSSIRIEVSEIKDHQIMTSLRGKKRRLFVEVIGQSGCSLGRFKSKLNLNGVISLEQLYDLEVPASPLDWSLIQTQAKYLSVPA